MADHVPPGQMARLLREVFVLSTPTLVFAWVGAKGHAFNTPEEAADARATFLYRWGASPAAAAAAAAAAGDPAPAIAQGARAEYDRCWAAFTEARDRDEATERHVSHLLVAAWEWWTGLPGFVVNDNARADVSLCVGNTWRGGSEAWLSVQIKTCQGGGSKMEFGAVRGYCGLLVITCDISALSAWDEGLAFMVFSGSDLDKRLSTPSDDHPGGNPMENLKLPNTGDGIWDTQLDWRWEGVDWSTGLGRVHNGGQCVSWKDKEGLRLTADCSAANAEATLFYWMGAAAPGDLPVYPYLRHANKGDCVD
eukprot:gene7486-5263_t